MHFPCLLILAAFLSHRALAAPTPRHASLAPRAGRIKPFTADCTNSSECPGNLVCRSFVCREPLSPKVQAQRHAQYLEDKKELDYWVKLVRGTAAAKQLEFQKNMAAEALGTAHIGHTCDRNPTSNSSKCLQSLFCKFDSPQAKTGVCQPSFQ